MALVTADDSRTPCFGSKNTQTVIAEENEVEKNIKAGESQSQNPNKDCIPVEKSTYQEKITTNEILDEGCSVYGYVSLTNTLFAIHTLFTLLTLVFDQQV